MMNWLAALLMTLSATGATEDGRQQLDRFAAGLESLSGRFEQVTVDADGDVTERSSGRLYYARPDRFRWSYAEPFPQEIVADGEQLWHYDQSLEQVTVRPQPGAAESPLLVLTRPELLDRFYRVVTSEADLIEFVPLQESVDIERGRLFFSNGLPSQLELEDSFGQLTRLNLSQLERNPNLSDERFRFEVPEGADVLEGF
jgi:outer membrane lipoprotein carrier protein